MFVLHVRTRDDSETMSKRANANMSGGEHIIIVLFVKILHTQTYNIYAAIENALGIAVVECTVHIK